MENSTTTGTPLPWPNAFCALAMVAINTAVQECSPIHGLSPAQASALRLSPVFCLYNTIDVMLRILCNGGRKSLRQAVRDIAGTRGRPAQAMVGRRTCLRASRVLGFGFAVLQLIKLLACHGIPWTQTFAAMYIMSYLAHELINLSREPFVETHLAVPNSEIDVKQFSEDNTSSAIAIPWLLPQMILWVYCLSFVAPSPDMKADILFDQPYPLWYMILAVLLVGLITMLRCLVMSTPLYIMILLVLGIDLAIAIGPSIAFQCAVYFCLQKYCPDSLVALAAVFDAHVTTVCSTVGVPLALVMVYWQAKLAGLFRLTVLLFGNENFDWLFENLGPSLGGFLEHQAFPLAGGILVLLAAGMASSVLFRVLFMGRLSRLTHLTKGKLTDVTWACGFTLVANLVTAFEYYSQVYDERGTFRPGWTRMLG